MISGGSTAYRLRIDDEVCPIAPGNLTRTWIKAARKRKPTPRLSATIMEVDALREPVAGSERPISIAEVMGWHPRPTVRERLLANITEGSGGCWIFTGTLNLSGYGVFGGHGMTSSHRAAFVEYRGPIPEGLELDHLCRVPACCNPDHLEPVTTAENMRRMHEARTREGLRPPLSTHCKRDHEYTPENTWRSSEGTRVCRRCNLDGQKLRRTARKQELQQIGATS